MQVILLATNESDKLRPLTETVPAPLVRIVNRPVMEIVTEIVARAGYKDLLVSLHQHGGSIASHFGNGGRWGVHLKYVMQREAWGSAGALQWAVGFIEGTLLVLPADAILDLDIEQALAFHRANRSAATLILHRADNDRPVRPVRVDTQGRVLDAAAQLADGQVLDATGAYIFERHILEHIPARTPYDCYDQLVPALLAEGVTVYGYEMQGYWNALASFQAYQDAQQVFLYSAYTAEQDQLPANLPRVRYPSIEGRQIAPGIWIGYNHVIHPNARLAPPLCIAENCRIGRDAELGPGTVLGASVVVDDAATVYKSTVLERTYVGRLVNLNNRIVDKTTIVNAQTGESVQVVDPFLLSVMRPIVSRSGRVRRLLNRLAALVLIAVTLPLTSVLAVLVYLTTDRRSFCRVPYVGKPATAQPGEGVSAELQTLMLLAFQTCRKDGTPTAFGQWLQHWELDKLPRLLDVLRGDLAMVGVKPLLPDEANQLYEEWHLKRSECPAGFTGLWYIQTEYGSDLEEVLLADAYYAATRTRPGEVRLLLQTPFAWLRRRRAQSRSKWMPGKAPERIDNIRST